MFIQFTRGIFQKADSDSVGLMQGPRHYISSFLPSPLPPSLLSFFSFFLLSFSFFFWTLEALFLNLTQTEHGGLDDWTLGQRKLVHMSLAVLLQGTKLRAGLGFCPSVQWPCPPAPREGWPLWAADLGHHPQWEDSSAQSL